MPVKQNITAEKLKIQQQAEKTRALFFKEMDKILRHKIKLASRKRAHINSSRSL
jgi:hypothetical protein